MEMHEQHQAEVETLENEIAKLNSGASGSSEKLKAELESMK
jgi:hypothetical protein